MIVGLLNLLGIDVRADRILRLVIERMMSLGARSVSKPAVFISYSHKDVSCLELFWPYIETLKGEEGVQCWYDGKITEGAVWEKEIVAAMEEASVAVLFISQPFLASKFVAETELPWLLRAFEKKKLTLLPVFVSPSQVAVNDKTKILTKIQGFASPTRTLGHMNEIGKQEVFLNLSNRIRELIAERRSLPLAPGTEAGKTLGKEAMSGVSEKNSVAAGVPERIYVIDSKAGTPKTRKVKTTKQKILEPLPGLRLLPVPGGIFTMGDNQGRDFEKPEHRVELSPFGLAETPVTNQHYGIFILETKYREPFYWRDQKYSDPQQPVVGVAWQDAVAFCEWLSKKSGKEFFLPSEAQWEYAARGPEGCRHPWGDDDPTKELACFGLDYGNGKPALVGRYPAGAGPFGHLDLAGNVWEWCRDVWDNQVYKKRADGTMVKDPVVKRGNADVRSIRGGSWFRPASYLRVGFRGDAPAGGCGVSLGFRLAAPASTLNP
ncbi:MAG: SUMF1/EgtB/PvdO family nonheme iron enzyme [Magnetococcales bacterium]|nr:SUMF1/EgtB/PvdO family nonheme iron enzyme [Magnetococcales bacterium]